MYQQDDRDIRAERGKQKLEPNHNLMLSAFTRGVITPEQWLAIDKFADSTHITVAFALLLAKPSISRCIKAQAKIDAQTLNGWHRLHCNSGRCQS